MQKRTHSIQQEQEVRMEEEETQEEGEGRQGGGVVMQKVSVLEEKVKAKVCCIPG